MTTVNERGCFHANAESCFKAACPTTLTDTELKAKRIRDARQRDELNRGRQEAYDNEDALMAQREAARIATRPARFVSETPAENKGSTRKAEKRELKERQRAHERKRLDRQEAIWDAADKVREAESLPDTDTDGDFESFTVDLASGDAEQPLPAILERSDGRTLLYAGKLNSIFGTPGSGKSWISLLAAHETVLRGGRAIYWDFEDSPETVRKRSKVLSFDPTNPDFKYCRADMVESDKAMTEAKQWLLEAPDISVVVIDGVEASGCPSDGRDVAPWFAKFVDVWDDERIGIITVDHVTKNKDEDGLRPLGPIGSQAKLARVTGAALQVSGLPWTQDQAGRVALHVHKDRPGQVGRTNTLIAMIHGGYEELDGHKPVFPILGVFRLNGQPKRDDGMIFGSCKARQSPVYPIRDAFLAVNHASCPSLSSSGPRQWGESALKTSRLPGALSLLAKSWLYPPSAWRRR